MHRLLLYTIVAILVWACFRMDRREADELPVATSTVPGAPCPSRIEVGPQRDTASVPVP